MIVPCGRCYNCLRKRRDDWTIRLKEHFKDYNDASFITLTYEDGFDNYGNLSKADLQLFIKKLRRYKKGCKITYYAVGEYGTKTFRPHYHLIVFGVANSDIMDIQKAWNFDGVSRGFVYVGTVTERSISYVAKYHVNKTQYPAGCEPSFVLMSKSIGLRYVDHMKKHHSTTEHAYYSDFQFKKSLPRYYKDKLYNKTQKAMIVKKRELSENNISRITKWLQKHPNSKSSDYFKDCISRYEEAQRLFNEKSKLNQKL